MVILVRTDLKMSVGKTSAQVGHGVVGSYKKALKSENNYIKKWELLGQKKIVLEVNSENELLDKYEKTKKMNIPCCLVRDAGKTEVEPNTCTVCAIGPFDSKYINKIVGSLKLLK